MGRGGVRMPDDRGLMMVGGCKAGTRIPLALSPVHFIYGERAGVTSYQLFEVACTSDLYCRGRLDRWG